VTRAWIDGDQVDQPALLAVDVRDLLPVGHRVWDVLELVAELDVSAFVAAYRADGRGRRPYDPRMMLALVVYCRGKGICSGRGIEAACHDDLGARVITGNRYPDRATVDRFLDTHAQAIRALLPQTLRLGYAQDLVDVSLVAGDGTKALANAAMGATVDEQTLQAQIADLERQVALAQADWDAQIAVQDAPTVATLFGDADAQVGPAAGQPGKAWRRLGVLTRMLHSRQQALAYLQAHPNTALSDWRERLARDQARVQRCAEGLEQTRVEVAAACQRREQAQARGVKIPGTRPVPVAEHARVRQARKALATATARAQTTAASRPTTSKVNTTDPVSRIMPGKHHTSASVTTFRPWPAKASSSSPSAPMTVPTTSRPSPRCCRGPGPTLTPPPSPTPSGWPCSTTATPPKPTSPPTCQSTLCSSRSRKKPARPDGYATA